jgi:hypothetical protein
MRILGYTLADPSTPMPPPDPEMFVKMDELVAEATKAGVMLATGGLVPADEGIKVKYSDAEAKELVGGWALLEVRDKAEAIEWTKRFLSIVGEGETTLREVAGPPPM